MVDPVRYLTAPLDELRILRKPALLELVGLCEQSVRNLELKGDFPARVALGANSIGWVEAEVRAWLADRATKRRAVEPLGARAGRRPALPATSKPAGPVGPATPLRSGNTKRGA